MLYEVITFNCHGNIQKTIATSASQHQPVANGRCWECHAPHATDYPVITSYSIHYTKLYEILVIGSGGREHALVWKIAQSPLVSKVYCAPGNPGTALLAENVPLKVDDLDGLLTFAKTEKIDLTVVGPELPLSLGIVDRFEDAGLLIFGARQNAAIIEASKVFSKDLMKKYDVPTAFV